MAHSGRAAGVCERRAQPPPLRCRRATDTQSRSRSDAMRVTVDSQRQPRAG